MKALKYLAIAYLAAAFGFGLHDYVQRNGWLALTPWGETDPGWEDHAVFLRGLVWPLRFIP